MKKLKLGIKFSRVIVVIYLFFTLLFRFLIEAQFNGLALISIGFGFFCLLFLWALIKAEILNPHWFWFEKAMKESK